MEPLLQLIGASSGTWDYAKEYLTIVAYSAPFCLVANCYANIVRTEGKAGTSMAEQVLGNLLNIVLDPVMILALNMGVAMKVTMITGMICIEFSQGVQPLLGYCIGAKNYDRFKKALSYLFIDPLSGALLA